MKLHLSLAAALVAVGSLAAPAMAHHSGAMFDDTKTVTLTGQVKEFQYTNPHSWLEVMVPDNTGKLVQWGFEDAGPDALLRQGIKVDTFKPGDKVTVTSHPMKDGRPAGSLMKATAADGHVYGPQAGK